MVVRYGVLLSLTFHIDMPIVIFGTQHILAEVELCFAKSPKSPMLLIIVLL